MEVYAGFFSFADYHIGRLIDALDQIEALDDTLIYYIIGDNGASAEGTLQGTFNEMIPFNGMNALETAEFLTARIDKLGGPESYNHYAVGWAHAMDTPYQWTKQVASHWGGTRNGTIVRWPKGIKAKGEYAINFITSSTWRPRFSRPRSFPSPTWSIALDRFRCRASACCYSFDDAKRRRTPRNAVLRNVRQSRNLSQRLDRGNAAPHALAHDRSAPPFDDDVWELYDTNKDWSQAHDLSKEMPDKLHELQRLWLIEATRNNVLPMDDRAAERFNSDVAGRPVLVRGNSQVLANGMGALNENGVINIKNKSHSITAQLIIPEGKPANGVILSQGGIGGGWMFYVKDGKPMYLYNFVGLHQTVIESTQALTAGTHQVRMEFAYDGGGLAKGGNVTLYIDGEAAGNGRLNETVPMVFSADETSDVGVKHGSPMTPDMPPGKSAFNGTVSCGRY